MILLVAVPILLVALWLFFGTKDHPSHSAPPVPATERPTIPPLEIASVSYPTPLPVYQPEQVRPPVDWALPTAAPNEVAAALDRPVSNSPQTGTMLRDFDPLTILPLRSRSSVISYNVRRGDNLDIIASRFGINTSTIIWSNDRFYVNAMRVGLELTILPVDGVYHHTTEPQTIAAIADEYKVDPYAIIDSEYNTLFGATPQTTLPENFYVVVPGGTGSTEPVYWDPGITVSTTGAPSGGGASIAMGAASFALDDPGSCGRTTIYGGSPPTTLPIQSSYRVTQEYSWAHPAIDLGVPVGTLVYAAGGGTVIFNGESTWGYGWTVVIAHGSTLTLYGHLNGDFVSCGQVVTAGQNIAVSGNSGNSSGPHLHFEIRGSNGVPGNPRDWMTF
jgi:murein DD-endopeptidase MepM/ murein hydrolase activator NlpD